MRTPINPLSEDVKFISCLINWFSQASSMHVDITLAHGLMLGIFIMTNKFIDGWKWANVLVCVCALMLFSLFIDFFFLSDWIRKSFFMLMRPYHHHSLVGYDSNFPMIFILKSSKKFSFFCFFSGSWNHHLSSLEWIDPKNLILFSPFPFFSSFKATSVPFLDRSFLFRQLFCISLSGMNDFMQWKNFIFFFIDF